MLLAAIAFPAAARAQAPEKFHIEARFMFWADASERDAVPNQNGTITDLFVRRARLSIQGSPTDTISFSLQVGEDNIGAKVLTSDGSIRVKDAFVTYGPAAALRITAGQFKIPFTRSNLESGFNQVLVDRGTLPSFRPAREGSRDLGVMAWGDVNRLQYRVALFDGSDQERDNPDSSLRVSTRLSYNWFAQEPGFSYTGTYLGNTRVLQVAANLDAQQRRLDPKDDEGFQQLARDYRAVALEAFFEQPLAHTSALTVEGAWLHRSDDYLDAVADDRTRDGYYAQGAFLLPGRLGPGRLQVAIRRERWDDERGEVTQENARTTAGAAYYLKGHNQKVQADFTRKREIPDVDNDEFRLSLVLVF